MPVKGDDIWNSVLSDIERTAGSDLAGQAEQEQARRDQVGAEMFPQDAEGGNPDAPFTGRDLVAGGYRLKDAATAAIAGVEKGAYEVKDFVFGEPTQGEKSTYRKETEQASRELKAMSKWNGVVESIAQFAVPFSALGKVVGTGKWLVDAGRAAVVGATAFDPTEERLSNLIQTVPALQNPVTEFLAAKPEDGRAAGRLKNAVESLAMDAVAATAFVAAAKFIKFSRQGDKVAAEAAMKELDDANIRLAQQEAEHYRKSFIDEAFTDKANTDIQTAGASVDPQAPGMNKSFGGEATSQPAGQPPGLGGRAEALDREMRQSPEMPEVPGAGPEGGAAADVPAAPSAATPQPPTAPEQPFGGGGMADALDKEMRANGELPTERPASGPAPAGAEPPVVPLGPDVADAARGGTPRGAPAEGVQNVTPELAGARGAQPPKLHDVTPEQVQKLVQRGAKDDEAVARNGSVEAALQDGHKFAGPGTIPWQKLEAPGGVQQFIRDVVEINSDTLHAARGGDAEGVLRDTRVEKLAGQMGRLFEVDPQMILGQLKQAGDNARMMVVQMETGYRLANRAFLDNYEFLRRLEAGNLQGHATREAALEEFRKRTMLAMDLYSNAQSILSNSGRAMRRAREEFKIRADQMAKVDVAQMDPDKLAKLFLSTNGDPVAMAKATKPGILAQIVDGVSLFRMANILSGPTTQVVNMVSNTAMLAFRPITTYTGAAMKGAYAAMTQNEVMGASARALRTRSKVELLSTTSTIMEGMQAFKKAWLLGDSVMMPHNSSEVFSAFDGGMGGTVHSIPWNDFKTIDDVIANGIKGLTYVATADLRLMGAADEMVKNMRYRGVLMGRAAVQAEELGMKPGTKAFNDFIRDKANAGFDANGRAIDADAFKEARATTFQQDVKLPVEDTWWSQGHTLGSLGTMANNSMKITKLVVPFVKTPANLFRYGIKLTPGLNLLQKEYVNSLRGMHGEVAQATAMGEMAMGILLMGAAMELRLNDKITGSGPRDPKQASQWKALGNMPYAVNIGDGQHFQINRFDPIQMPVALAADFVDMYMMNQNKGDMDQMENIATGITLALAHQLKDKTYFKGASDFIEAMMDDRKLKSWSERFAPGFIPGVGLLRSVNPDPYVHEINGLMDSVKANIPGYSETVPVRYDALGRPIQVPGRFVGTKDADSPLLKALDEQFAMTGTYLSAPQPKVEGIDLREITLEKSGDNAFEAYNKLIAKPKGAGTTLEKALEKVVTSKNYGAAPHGEAGTANTKEYMVAQVLNNYRQAAMQQLKAENPDLREKLGMKARDAFNKAMAGKKELKSTEANAVGKQLNDLLNANGFGSVPIPQPLPQQ
jgi:hypothetical protein